LPDIDHIRIATERQRATRLLNDRKRIECISEILAKTELTHDGNSLAAELEQLCPFAMIDEVFANSPAEKAGLQNGDFLIRFGEATTSRSVPSQIVEGQLVILKVFRIDRNSRTAIDVTITPDKWDGTGLVGAHLQPYQQ
jgi:predicted metalloprotease with PDZ domain